MPKREVAIACLLVEQQHRALREVSRHILERPSEYILSAQSGEMRNHEEHAATTGTRHTKYIFKVDGVLLALILLRLSE